MSMPTPTSDPIAARLAPHLSRERARTIFQELLRVPSPQTDLLEEEPQLREFMKVALVPRMRELGMTNTRQDAMGNLIAESGAGRSGRSLMLVTHAMNQPPSTMPDPYGGKVIDATPHGLPGEAVLGKGASEQKGTMAAMLHAMEAVRSAGVALDGRLVFVCCVSGETGKHDAIRNVVERENVRTDLAFVYGNSLKLQLGNRGRVDVKVIVRGQPSPLQPPARRRQRVTGAMEVLRRLAAEIPQDRAHPQLGAASLTCNRIESFPKSTHTVQDRCEIGLDRRLLPGDDPDAVVEEIARVVRRVDGWADPVSGKPLRVEVEKGAVMYPSLVRRGLARRPPPQGRLRGDARRGARGVLRPVRARPGLPQLRRHRDRELRLGRAGVRAHRSRHGFGRPDLCRREGVRVDDRGLPRRRSARSETSARGSAPANLGYFFAGSVARFPDRVAVIDLYGGVERTSPTRSSTSAPTASPASCADSACSRASASG